MSLPFKNAWRAHIGKDEEHFGFIRVCDPHFGTIDDPIVPILRGTRLESKRV